ncbi:MAG: hypothetical protein JXB62_12415 [Pirellulales bacterium]|nr:hypothetical protein [Pirellulales bacterium]
MTARYLLACSCGKKIPVEPRKAGEFVRCECGASLEIPGLLDMAKLPRIEAEDSAAESTATWGVRQSLGLLGVLTLGLALVFGVLLIRNHPKAPDSEVPAEEIRLLTQNLSPLQTWQHWRYFKQYGLDSTPLPSKGEYAESSRRWRLCLAALVIFTTAGIALSVVPLLATRGSRRGSP